MDAIVNTFAAAYNMNNIRKDLFLFLDGAPHRDAKGTHLRYPFWEPKCNERLRAEQQVRQIHQNEQMTASERSLLTRPYKCRCGKDFFDTSTFERAQEGHGPSLSLQRESGLRGEAQAMRGQQTSRTGTWGKGKVMLQQVYCVCVELWSTLLKPCGKTRLEEPYKEVWSKGVRCIDDALNKMAGSLSSIHVYKHRAPHRWIYSRASCARPREARQGAVHVSISTMEMIPLCRSHSDIDSEQVLLKTESLASPSKPASQQHK